MSIRFQRQVVNLRPDLVIFFDGYNEFNSISYGGNYGDDFYWTVTGNNRMHYPYRLYIDKIIELSAFFELALIHTGLYQSSRNVSGIKINEKDIQNSARTYLEDKQNTKVLCESYKIKCVFVIQPHIFNSQIIEHLDIMSYHLKNKPFTKKIITKGYDFILNTCIDCINLSGVLDNINSTFIDPVHFSKRGSEEIANYLKKIISENLNIIK
jgi:hypothetical protein